jgi:AraC family transcriptional regulator
MIPCEGISVETETSVSTPDCVVELKTYDWNTLDFVGWRHPSCSIALVINHPSSTRTYWRIDGEKGSIETGMFAAVPGNFDYQVRQACGLKRTVTCTVEDDVFTQTTGAPADWFNPDFVNQLGSEDARPRRILNVIGQELIIPRLAREVAIEGYCLVLLAEVARITRRIRHRQPHGSARLSLQQLRRLKELIDSNLHCGPTVTMMARELGMSRSHLSRLFKASTGSTLQAHVEAARLARIQELLTHTSLPLKAIAARVGISSGNYLSAAFSRSMGLSPSDYRQRSRAS